MDVPEPVMLAGVNAQVAPVAGIMFEVRLMSPANPSSAVTVNVEFPETPARRVKLVGLAATVKS